MRDEIHWFLQGGKGVKTIMEYKILRLTINMQFGDIENVVYPTLLCDKENIILVDCGFIGSLHILEKDM